MLPFIPTLLESTFVYLFCFGMILSAKTVFLIPHEHEVRARKGVGGV